MLPSSATVVRGVITQRGGQQSLQCRAPPELEKHESFEVHGAHPAHKIVGQSSKVEVQKEWRHRDRELLQFVLRRESVHLYPRSGRSGEHQIVQRAVLGGVRGKWMAILDNRRNAS